MFGYRFFRPTLYGWIFLKKRQLRKVIRPEPSILTLYWRWSNLSTILPVLTQRFWRSCTATMLVISNGGRVWALALYVSANLAFRLDILISRLAAASIHFLCGLYREGWLEISFFQNFLCFITKPRMNMKNSSKNFKKYRRWLNPLLLYNCCYLYILNW